MDSQGLPSAKDHEVDRSGWQAGCEVGHTGSGALVAAGSSSVRRGFAFRFREERAQRLGCLMHDVRGLGS